MKQLLTLGAFVLGMSAPAFSQNYQQYLVELEQQRIELHKQTNPVDTSSKLLFTTLTNYVFPEWYGTPWDFNGISNVPGKGHIACGYFVSTTLKHCGFNLNRYKLAQQAASVIINELVGASSCYWYNSVQELNAAIVSNNKSLYVVGLDFHVGFLVVENSKVYFVHSDYVSGAVLREKLSESDAISYSERFVVGEITNNNDLINKWLKGERVY